MSKPALQKAETEVNTPFHTACAPYLGQKHTVRMSAPAPSKQKVVPRAPRTSRPMSPMSLRLKLDTAMSRWLRDSLRFTIRAMRKITDMNPRPPSWMSSRMTTWPNSVHAVRVSTRIRPVTQVADVAGNSAVISPQLSPDTEAMGSISSRVPHRITAAKEMVTIWVARRTRRFLVCVCTSPVCNRIHLIMDMQKHTGEFLPGMLFCSV